MTTVPARRPSFPLLLAFTVSVVIALAVVARRALVLAWPPAVPRPGFPDLDTPFAAHAVGTVLHLAPAAIFVLTAVLLALRMTQRPWIRPVFYFSGLCTGLSAFAMSTHPVGGLVEQTATVLFGSWFLISLGAAFTQYRRNQPDEERTWILRATGVALGIATTRPIMGIFFALSRSTHWTPADFFGPAFFLGFGLNTIAVECWLRYRRRQLTGK